MITEQFFALLRDFTEMHHPEIQLPPLKDCLAGILTNRHLRHYVATTEERGLQG